VPGASWTGAVLDWRDAPSEYAAIHFLADAIEDCGWPADWTVKLPDDTPSGFYAARVHGDIGTDLVPFFVRPGRTRASILFIAPSATYLSYANSRFWWEDPIQELVQDRLVELGAEEQYLLVHPELGLSNYDQHLDGTAVCYSTSRRPNLNMRPGHVRGEGYATDLHVVAWLEHLGVGYDVVTDAEWHLHARDLLDRYDVVITGTHPEYVSLRMLDSATEWVDDGGRLMYLGGNGFSMNITFDPARPWIMENRRVELWEGDRTAAEARAHNSIDGERGGHFAPSGRQPARLTGVESATMGFDHSYPYHLGPAARRPEVAFALEGISGDVIGTGVVGQEWDNAAGCEVGPGHVVLGSSEGHSLVPPLFGAMRPDYHADLVLYLRGQGGAFSVSSMAWAGELDSDGYDNDVARMTGNVLRRFLDPTPLTEGHLR
jgi:N,N-dimethylformamidase